MLLNHGELNDLVIMNPIKEMYSPHTQLENEYGYNGYNLWVTSELVKEKGEGVLDYGEGEVVRYTLLD